MNHKISCLLLLFVLAGQASAGNNDDYVTNHITFKNNTPYPVIATTTPYLDNFSSLVHYVYAFSKPNEMIAPYQITQTEISYDWHFNWFGVSQFAYNYENRSRDYGCFITEIRLSWRWGSSYHIVIASYRKDPNYPNDYLVCHATQQDNKNHLFAVDLNSSQNDNEKNDLMLNDTERYSIAGDSYELAKSSYFYLNKPIFLNPTLTLYPNQLKPEATRNDPPKIEPDADRYDEMSVVNHTTSSLIAKPPLLDEFSQFSDQYYFEQPKKISPGEEVKIKIGVPDFSIYSFAGWGATNFNLQQFGYQKSGYANDSGCYITFTHHFSDTPITAFYFDHHQSNNIYCLVTSKNRVEIYDDPTLFHLSASGCRNNDLESCVSTSNPIHRFVKKGDHLTAPYAFMYNKLPLSSNHQNNEYLAIDKSPNRTYIFPPA